VRRFIEWDIKVRYDYRLRKIFFLAKNNLYLSTNKTVLTYPFAVLHRNCKEIKFLHIYWSLKQLRKVTEATIRSRKPIILLLYRIELSQNRHFKIKYYRVLTLVYKNIHYNQLLLSIPNFCKTFKDYWII
jgi:hypothetical protein